MDRLSSMTAFVRAVDSGSFAGAARLMGASAQMVAKHITFLEQRMGARLLNRTTRRQGLTEIGALYYEQCKSILADVERAEETVSGARTAPRGRLRINAPISFGSESLVPMLTRFREEYPQIEIDLTLNDRIVDLVEDGFDVVFRIGPLPDSTLIARAVAPFRLVACAAPRYIERNGEPAQPADLKTHECIGYGTYPSTGEMVWDFIRDGVTSSIAVPARLRINNARAIRTAALEGYGIALIADDLVRQALKDGNLRKILPDYQTGSRPMHMLFAPDRQPTAKLRRFIDAAAKAFAPP